MKLLLLVCFATATLAFEMPPVNMVREEFSHGMIIPTNASRTISNLRFFTRTTEAEAKKIVRELMKDVCIKKYMTYNHRLDTKVLLQQYIEIIDHSIEIRQNVYTFSVDIPPVYDLVTQCRRKYKYPYLFYGPGKRVCHQYKVQRNLNPNEIDIVNKTLNDAIAQYLKH
jgi:3'-phosphoadenosine 5'-phosphosulfate sulfotransferase (PAPS reductase)/FAD synthetase